MRKSPRILAIAVALLSQSAAASTGFRVAGKSPQETSHYAISTGWYSPVRAAVTLNPRHLHRNGALEAGVTNATEWTSRYWSLSQTMFGAGFPMSGVNERGLTIQSTILRNRPYPTPPARAVVLQRSQWSQYHLDTSASLAEVISKSVTGEHPVIPHGTINAQFQVCDPKDCAVISYYDDKVVAHGSIGRIEVSLVSGAQKIDKANRWPWATVSNHLLEESIASAQRCKTAACDGLDDSLARFGRVTAAVQGYGAKAVDLSQVFADLATVDQGYPKTTWNEVYTIQKRGDRSSVRMAFKAPAASMESLQWIEVDDRAFDVDCKGPRAMWWIDLARGGGDRTREHIEPTRAVQETLAMQHAKESGGVFPRDILEPMVSAPETKTRCERLGAN